MSSRPPYPSNDSNDMVPLKWANTSSKTRSSMCCAAPGAARPPPRAAVQLLQDEAEVRDLVMRYAHLQDLGRFDDLLALCH